MVQVERASKMSPELLLKQNAIDHLVLNCNGSKDELTNKSPHELFVMVYHSLEKHLLDRKSAKDANEFEKFKVADETIWEHGFALFVFGLAELLGWMKDSLIVNHDCGRNEESNASNY